MPNPKLDHYPDPSCEPAIRQLIQSWEESADFNTHYAQGLYQCAEELTALLDQRRTEGQPSPSNVDVWVDVNSDKPPGRLEGQPLQRLRNIVANLAHPKGDHSQNDLEDEAHDIIRELRQPPQDDLPLRLERAIRHDLEKVVASLRQQLAEAQQARQDTREYWSAKKATELARADAVEATVASLRPLLSAWREQADVSTNQGAARVWRICANEVDAALASLPTPETGRNDE
jgi:hypothetical protein